MGQGQSYKYVIALAVSFFMVSKSLLVLADLDDPTRPPEFMPVVKEEKVQVEMTYTLSSILISPRRRVAIVNGKTIKTDDWLGKYQVQSIDRSSVTLVGDGKRLTLKLLVDSVKPVREKSE